MKSCLIADDHALMRGALAGLVSCRWPGAVIVEAGDFTAAVEAAQGLGYPALCLVDLDMPGATPRAGVAALRDAAPDAAIIIVTGGADDRLMRDLLALDVAGFIHKTASPDIVTAAIALVLAGGRYLPPRVADLLADAQPPKFTLTVRQTEVLRLIAAGCSNKRIALELGLSPATVKVHVAQVLVATRAANRTEAAIKAREAGLA